MKRIAVGAIGFMIVAILATMNADNTYFAYLPIVNRPAPTAIPLPTVTRAPQPQPTAFPTAMPRECNSDSPDWRGANSVYPFCVAKDLAWVDWKPSNPFYCPCRVITDKNGWIAVEWELHGIQSLEIAVDASSQLIECRRGAGGGFRRAIPSGGRMSFTATNMSGLYKIELYAKRLDGVVVGHNEVFFCVT